MLVWTKAPITNKIAFEALDMLLYDITCIIQPFNEKLFVLEDVFQQILLVLCCRIKIDIINICLKFFYLYPSIQKNATHN